MTESKPILSPESIAPYLNEIGRGSVIHVYPVLESTNSTAKEMAMGGCPHGSCVIANRQTAGRGRRGRGFYSPPGSGLYFSILLCTEQLGLEAISTVTAAAAVLVCRAIEAVSGRRAQIKWVNDVLMEGKKVCGILAEAGPARENGEAAWVVVGIGINITTRDFPQELRTTAGSVFGENDEPTAVQSRLAGELINRLLAPGALTDSGIFTEYKERLMLIERCVTVHAPAGDYSAVVRGLEADYKLIVEKADGSLERLFYEEVSLRL